MIGLSFKVFKGPAEKARYLATLAKLDIETLRILHEIAQRPDIAAKLRINEGRIKAIL